MEEKNQKAIQLTLQQLKQYQSKQIQVTLQLLSEGNTVPFIARYRKEMTQSLDEVAIKEIEDTYRYLENFVNRQEEVTRLIDEQGELTDDIKMKLAKATKLQQLEDIYRPFKQKRRTKATIAKEKGLEPLAKWLLQNHTDGVEPFAQHYLNPDVDVNTVEDALDGAHEIIAEMIGDEPAHREWLRHFVLKNGLLTSAVKDAEKDERNVYEIYYAFSEPIAKVKPHRILAINRGEKAGVLKVAIDINTTSVMDYFEKYYIKQNSAPSAMYIRKAYEDSFKRFIFPSIEREMRQQMTQIADEQAIHVFSDNLKNLLLQPPLKGKVVLGLDPAYRTGCKLAIVDETGRVLHKGVIYPHKPAPEYKRQEAGTIFKQLLKQYGVSTVAIGNGTASRESEQFVAQQLKEMAESITFIIVNEAGASVYSASEIARQEFPDFQVEERSAVSIARRLQDPLAELVKIDPKSVGVGQYQHDVSQKSLEQTLDFVVETVVNQVGVNLNTASVSLLQHVSGLNKTIATNIVRFRDEHGVFKNRQQLQNVPRLGPKAFEQSAGFLRIVDGDNILDNTEIHPENYEATKKLLKAFKIDEALLNIEETKQQLQAITVQEAMALTGLGQITIEDILKSLEKPGRDIRDAIAAPLLRSDVLAMADLKVGMQLEGTVRNVVDFGAFIDIGVKQDGLVHLSKMSQKFVKHASDIVSVGDIVTVWIDQVDVEKGRISLTMIAPN